MFRNRTKSKQNSSVLPKPKRSRSVQPKPEAWSIQKSSLVRLGPPALAKSPSFRKSEKFVTAGTSIKQLKTVRKPMPTSVLGKMKADLDTDALEFSSRLKQLLPTVKSLNSRVPRRTRSPRTPRRGKTTEEGASTYPKSAKMDDSKPFNLTMAPPPMGEKLITVGGYIISLQTTRDDITSVVKPRISTDKEGLEVEIKINGCKPTDIRFERRYATLIVIGVTTPPPPPPTSPIPRKSTFRGPKKTTVDLHQAGPSHGAAAATGIIAPDSLDEIQELVNIFVPKTISINQIFISSPDAKGRIFVKGP